MGFFWLILVMIILGLIFILRYNIEDGLACLAYYEQCTAEEIKGLTFHECFAREGAVVYLYSGICLVRPGK